MNNNPFMVLESGERVCFGEMEEIYYAKKGVIYPGVAKTTPVWVMSIYEQTSFPHDEVSSFESRHIKQIMFDHKPTEDEILYHAGILDDPQDAIIKIGICYKIKT